MTRTVRFDIFVSVARSEPVLFGAHPWLLVVQKPVTSYSRDSEQTSWTFYLTEST